jgi:hypothetical protein
MRTIKSEGCDPMSEVGGPNSGVCPIGPRTSDLGLSSCPSGQSMVETALILPILLTIMFNAINFGYFFLVAVNVAAAPRSGVEYSILGNITPGSLQLPAAGPPTTVTSVSYLVYDDMKNALYNPTSATVQVCTSANLNGSGSGTNGSGTGNVRTNCVTCANGSCGSVGTGSPAPAADSESPTFLLNRVDVSYKFSPLISATPFNIALLPASICSSSGGKMTCTFHRQVSMRVIN